MSMNEQTKDAVTEIAAIAAVVAVMSGISAIKRRARQKKIAAQRVAEAQSRIRTMNESFKNLDRMMTNLEFADIMRSNGIDI